MPCQWCVELHVAHIIWVWFWIFDLKKGDAQDKKLILALTLYFLTAYFVVGHTDHPLVFMGISQILMTISFLLVSRRTSGNLVGVIMAGLIALTGLSYSGYINSEVWLGPYAFTYWGIHGITNHIMLFAAWIFSNGKDTYTWRDG